MNHHQKSNTAYLKSSAKILSYFTIFILVLSTVISCEKDNTNDNTSDNDEYYVKYVVKSSTMYSLSRTAQIKSESYSNTNFTFKNSQWEMIIGPVKQGFNSSINASYDTSQNLARTYINVEIYVSKNNGPFALKANNNSTDVRMSASINYIVI